MKHRTLGVLRAIAVVVGLTLSVTATAGVGTWNQGRPWSWNQGRSWSQPSANLNLVHGIPGLAVDIYVVKDFNLFQAKELSDVTFGTAADLTQPCPA